MSRTLDGLTAELSELFTRVESVLKTIETSFSPDQCSECVRNLPAPSLQAFSKLLLMVSKHISQRPTSTQCGTEISVPSNHHEPRDEHLRSDRGVEISHRKPSKKPDPRYDLYNAKAIHLSSDLYKVLIDNQGDPQRYLNSIYPSSEDSKGVEAAFLRLHQNHCKDKSDKTYLDFCSLYRRLELRNLFLLVKEYGYHTGKRWCRNACEDFISKIQAKYPDLMVQSLLEEYVRLGRGYDKWAEELGGPEFLLVLPLTVTEYGYTGREYAGFFKSAIRKLRQHNIEKIVRESDLAAIGKAICKQLWNNSLSGDDSLERGLTKSRQRSKRKRQANMKNDHRKSQRREIERDEAGAARTPIDNCSRLDPDSDMLSEATSESSLQRPCSRELIASLDSGGQPEFLQSTQMATEFPDSADTFPSLDPNRPADFFESGEIFASVIPGDNADFIESTGMLTSLDFSQPATVTDRFPDSADTFPSLDPSRLADFFETAEMFPSVNPGDNAEFFDSTGILTSLDSAGMAEFSDPAVMRAPFATRGETQLPIYINAMLPFKTGENIEYPAQQN